MGSDLMVRAPSPEQTAEAIRQSKVFRRQGGSFDMMGCHTLAGGSYDAWVDAQPWPEESGTARELRC